MNILTFDIEDWFHILDHEPTNKISEWDNFESRIQIGVEHIIDVLNEKNIQASFFVVGWVVKKYPQIIRKISDYGHSIGSHTHFHQLVYKQNKNEFKNDVEMSVKAIEDCVGRKVENFRAPGFSITEDNKWAFDVLFELGIKRDSSIFPATRAHGGFESFPSSKPLIISNNGLEIKEFPINCYSLLNKNIVFSGGGYFRLLNYLIVKNLTLRSDYVMAYFHPRDFDTKQPLIPGLSFFRRFKCYVGINSCKRKLLKWLDDFEFFDIETADSKIDWKKSKIYKL